MKNEMKQVISPGGILAFFLGAIMFSAYFVFSFTEPTVAPPGGNKPAPINVGSSPQTKEGDICTLAGGGKCLSAMPPPPSPPPPPPPHTIVVYTASDGGNFGWSAGLASCVAGEVITGGGISCVSGGPPVPISIIHTRPSGNAWYAACSTTTGEFIIATVYAVCLKQ